MRKIILILLILSILAGCGNSLLPRGEYRQISPQEAQDMMSNYDVLILDVRTREEFDGGHISGAVLLPYNEIRERAEEVIPDREQIILVYCQRGRRSEIAAGALLEMGYTNVFDFGGIADWTGEIARGEN